MRTIKDLVSRRWLTFYACGLCGTMLGIGLALSSRGIPYVLLIPGVVVMFCVLILVEWRGLE